MDKKERFVFQLLSGTFQFWAEKVGKKEKKKGGKSILEIDSTLFNLNFYSFTKEFIYF